MNWQDDDSVLKAECARLQAENMTLRSALAVAEKMILRYREALHARLADDERVVPAWTVADVERPAPWITGDVVVPLTPGVRRKRAATDRAARPRVAPGARSAQRVDALHRSG